MNSRFLFRFPAWRSVLLAVAAWAVLVRPALAAGDPLTVSHDASYLLADGSVFIAGNDLMTPIVSELNARFQRAHPEFKFTMQLFGSGLGLSGVTAGKSAFGPMARDANPQEVQAFVARFGYAPLDVRIGWDNTPDADHFPPGKYPPAVWVNARNPVPALTLSEVAGIFTTGSPAGDITHWGQISGDEGAVGANGGDWAKRAIHVYLPILRGLPIVATTRLRLGGRPWSARVEYLPMGEDVINAVANDPFGVGLIGWFPTDEGWDRQTELGSKVRIMPLAEDHDSKVSHGGVGDLYPLAGALHLMVNRAPGKPLEPWLKAYLELALSDEGQALIASLTKSDGFIPLEPDDLAAERKKLEVSGP
jgi:phosphate transport system substrate-binding protein